MATEITKLSINDLYDLLNSLYVYKDYCRNNDYNCTAQSLIPLISKMSHAVDNALMCIPRVDFFKQRFTIVFNDK